MWPIIIPIVLLAGIMAYNGGCVPPAAVEMFICEAEK